MKKGHIRYTGFNISKEGKTLTILTYYMKLKNDAKLEVLEPESILAQYPYQYRCR